MTDVREEGGFSSIEFGELEVRDERRVSERRQERLGEREEGKETRLVPLRLVEVAAPS